MKINKTALKAIKDTHEKMNNIITNKYNSGVLENIEDEILDASELCDNLDIEVSDDEITLIRFLIGHAMYRGFSNGEFYQSQMSKSVANTESEVRK